MMPPAGRPRWGALGAGAALIVVLALLGAAVFPASPRTPVAANTVRTVSAGERAMGHGPVYSIALPDVPLAIPDGPNREQFQALCRLCHSPRLVLTQPRLPEKKWGEVVHKMVAVYGAPIPPEQERDIVAYLTAVHGTGR
jgi:hypothetical protein